MWHLVFYGKKISPKFIWSFVVIIWCHTSFDSYSIYLYFNAFHCSAAFAAEHSQQTFTSSNVVLALLLLNMDIFTPFFSVSIVEFEQVNVFWVKKALLGLGPYQNNSW